MVKCKEDDDDLTILTIPNECLLPLCPIESMEENECFRCRFGLGRLGILRETPSKNKRARSTRR